MTGFPTTVDLAQRQSIEELIDEGSQGHSRRERRVLGLRDHQVKPRVMSLVRILSASMWSAATLLLAAEGSFAQPAAPVNGHRSALSSHGDKPVPDMGDERLTLEP